MDSVAFRVSDESYNIRNFKLILAFDLRTNISFVRYVYDLPLHKSDEDTRENNKDLSFHNIKKGGRKKHAGQLNRNTKERK